MSGDGDRGAQRWVDLASERLGGEALLANDEFFAPKERLLLEAAPVWEEGRYTERGKWMDGWETRRRRTPGHDWCVIRLGRRGRVEQVVVDTSHFRGNHPEACSVDAADARGLGPEQLASAEGLWTEIVPRQPLRGHTTHTFSVAVPRTATHIRLRIHPDGGVARLRVHGRAVLELPELLATEPPWDLASLDVGGGVLACSDAFFGAPVNLIQPTRSTGMHDGWETRRRRGPGHDWVVVELGAPGTIERVEIDTSHFKGNAPGSAWIEACDELPAGATAARASTSEGGDAGAGGPNAASLATSAAATGDVDEAALADLPWRPLLPRVPLRPHELHTFAEQLTTPRRARLLRFNIDPDGGVARLRIIGEPDVVAPLQAGIERLDAAPEADVVDRLLACCGSRAFAASLAAARPFTAPAALFRRAEAVWRSLGEDEWLAAFAAHPEIGTSSRTTSWASEEQAGVRGAAESTLARLAEANRAYRERFGFLYLVCATGRSADEMLALVEGRLHNDRETELRVAAEEQRRITALRLLKLLESP